MDNHLSMGFHHFLFFVKLYLLIKTVLDIFTSYIHLPGIYQFIGICYGIITACIVGFSIWKHGYKSGTIALFIFILFDLVYILFVYFMYTTLQMNITNASLTTISYCILSVAALIVCFLYYKKRWSILR